MLLNTRFTPVLEVAPGHSPTAVARFLVVDKDPPRPARPVSSFHYYGIPPPARIPWLAILVSAGLHAVALLGFNHHGPPKKAVIVAEEPAQELLMMPDLKEPEEDKPKELNDDDELLPPSVSVPMLVDLPTMVPLSSSFVQPLDLTIPLKSDPTATKLVAIPTNILHGRPDDSGMKNLFNLSELDRPPEPIVQNPPSYPYELKRQGIVAQVRVGFIVDAQGNVIQPYIVSSSQSDFERTTIDAVKKWKFRPGIKNGRKVNTRVEQPVKFKVAEGDVN